MVREPKSLPDGQAEQTTAGQGQQPGEGVISILAPPLRLRIGALLQVDGLFLLGDEAADPSSLFIRRARLVLKGSVFANYEFNITPDFALNPVELVDAYVNVNYLRWLQLQVGKSWLPIGLIQPEANLLLAERPLTINLVSSRDVFAALHGMVANGAITYATGVANGAQNGERGGFDVDNHKTLFASVFLEPFTLTATPALRNFGIGFSLTSGHEGDGSLNSARPGSFRSSGRHEFFAVRNSTRAGAENFVRADGDHARLNPQLTYYYGPFGIQAEYLEDVQTVAKTSPGIAGDGLRRRLRHKSAFAAVSYFVTGQNASFIEPPPIGERSHFVIGRWGALELAARYGVLDVDDVAFAAVDGQEQSSFADPSVYASKASEWTVGINWYVNSYVRGVVNYEITRFEAARREAHLPTEHALIARCQLAF